MPKETIIISLGGSLVAPNDIDTGFLKIFKKTVVKFLDSPSTPLRSGNKFFIIVGGGKVCRNYQKAMLEFGADNAERDLMGRSEEHTSELQSQFHLVCRLLLEKKKKA